MHVFGVSDLHFMIVGAHDFFNGLVDGLYEVKDSGHLRFGITPLLEFLKKARRSMILPVLTIRSSAPAVLGRSARHHR